MDATRNRGRGRFLACFRPLTLDATDYDPPPLHSSPDRKKKLRRSLSATLKAVIFRTTLLKKSRSENSRDEYADRRISFSPFRGKGFIKSKKKNAWSKPPLAPDGGVWPSANASPLFSSDASQTSSVSSLSGSSPARSETDSVQGRVSTDHFKPTTKRRAVKKCSYIMEICVLLMCLAALIWGKVFAVVACTSAWLFIAPSGKVGRAESYGLSRTS